ncbi:MAG: tetratricopeptide repeat protein [Stenotrophomonas sp.]
MSLVYNALREDGQALPARLSPARLRRPAVLLLALLLAVPAGYALGRIDLGQAPGTAPAAALPPLQARENPPAVATVRVPETVSAVPAAAASPLATAGQPATAALPVATAETAAASPRATSSAMPVAPQEVAPAMAAATLPASAGAAHGPASTVLNGSLQVSQRLAGNADDDAIAGLQAGLQQAMAGNDLERAASLLSALSQQLPHDSLTLLRAQAWLAHARGDNAQAMDGYRRIVARVPDDAHAGANLALLQAAAGQPELARATLARLQVQHADHPLLRRAQAALENRVQ